MHKELEPYTKYEMSETLDELFEWRCKIEDAMAQLREVRANADEELIRRMKEKNLVQFKTQYMGGESVVKYGKKKKTKVDTRLMKKFLFGGKGSSQDMARDALAGGQSAWKAAKVQLMADTLAIPKLIETTHEDKIVVEIIQTEKLKQMGIIE